MQSSRRVVWLFFVLLFWGTVATASAHPLGNFTMNHLAKVETSHAGRLHVRYVLDIAEIPTFQIMHATSNGMWSRVDVAQWAMSEVPTVTSGLRVAVDGAIVPLQLRDEHARLRPGAAGLPILYWVADFSVPLGAGGHRIDVSDRVYADHRVGWKDIIVGTQSEPTHELQAYPNALIGSPRRVSDLRFDLAPSGAISNVVASEDAAPDVSGSSSIARTNALADMFSNPNRAPFFMLLTALVAFGLGALHAIEPGHGKALLAFTLVGSRATAKQAVILAASLTFAHTIGVLILGIVLFFAAGFVSESIYPWITLLSGIAVAIIGARNLARYLHARHGHDHADGLEHHHGDGKTAHTHAMPGSGPIDFRGAVVAAMSGGVAPCPAAIVVMLAALRLHQVGYGVLLIVIFSLGLASVLTGLGLAVVHGSALLQRSGKLNRLVSAGPLISAALISLVGAAMIGQGFVAQGIHASVWVIAGLALLAIGGYAFTPQHSHVHEVQPG